MGKAVCDRVQIAASSACCLRLGEPFIPAVEFCTPCWTAFLLVPSLCLPVKSDARAELKLGHILGRFQLPESHHPDGIGVLIRFPKHRAHMDGESCPFHTFHRPDPEGSNPQPFLRGVCVCVCCRLPSTRGSSCIPASGIHRDITHSPWHVAVLGSLRAPGWDVPQVRVPEEWFFLGGCSRGAGTAFPFV